MYMNNDPILHHTALGGCHDSKVVKSKADILNVLTNFHINEPKLFFNSQDPYKLLNGYFYSSNIRCVVLKKTTQESYEM